MRDHSAPYQIRIKEMMDRAGYGIWLFHRQGERLALAKPLRVEFETLGDSSGATYFGDRPPTFEIGYPEVHKYRIFDSVYDAMVEAGLRQSDKELAGEHRQQTKQLEREAILHDRTFSLFRELSIRQEI